MNAIKVETYNVSKGKSNQRNKIYGCCKFFGLLNMSLKQVRKNVRTYCFIISKIIKPQNPLS